MDNMNTCDIYDQGVAEIISLLQEIDDQGLRAAVCNVAVSVALNGHEKTAQAFLRQLRAHVEYAALQPPGEKALRRYPARAAGE